MFDITNKVALVTGGASGIGFAIVKELLRNNLRACTISDIDDKLGREAAKQHCQEFGPNKVIFVKTDVCDKTEFEAAFQATVSAFQNLDIVVNNAGIVGEQIWEDTVNTNFNGVVNGILLGMENYLQKYRSGSEGVIINIASITAIDTFNAYPVYTGTKHAVLGVTRAFGAQSHYNRTQVRIVAICPGVTETPSATNAVYENTLGPAYTAIAPDDIATLPVQSAECVGRAAVHAIKNGGSGSAWITENSEPAYEIDFPTRFERRKV